MSVTTVGALHLGSGPDLTGAFQSSSVGQGRGGSAKFGIGQHAARPQTTLAHTGTRPSKALQYAYSATARDLDNRGMPKTHRLNTVPADYLPITLLPAEDISGLPPALYQLLDPAADAHFLEDFQVDPQQLNNRSLDKLVGALGRSKATWRRAVTLYEWLLAIGHQWDDRLCTTLIRVCSQHGQAAQALQLYEWMRRPWSDGGRGGAGLTPTVFTYTAVMRAALSGNMVDRAYQVWDDAISAGCQPDCRMCTVLIEVCTRKGDTARALSMYDEMRLSPPDSRLAPSVHAYTAAMRAAAEGGQWQRALEVWRDMTFGGCRPTGHAYAAAISACAAGGLWQKAMELFDEMLMHQIKPDVVSCTALITALASDGQYERGERVVGWMVQHGVRPNVRTYTALITAMCNAKQWDRALETLRRMKTSQSWGHVEPNAYTYSAILKTMGEHGQWQLAERVFDELEAEALAAQAEQDATESHHALPGASWLNGAFPGVYGLPSPASVTDDFAFNAGANLHGAGSYGAMPILLAEEVLSHEDDDSSFTSHPNMPLNAPQQPFSLFSSSENMLQGSSLSDPAAQLWGSSPMAGLGPHLWTSNNAALSGVSLPSTPVQTMASRFQAGGSGTNWGFNANNSSLQIQRPAWPVRAPTKTPLNEVVCGAMMLAYERSGKCTQALGILDRARTLGIQPNTTMYNTAMSALAKSGRVAEVEALFQEVPVKDTVTHETLIGAYGIGGDPQKAERALRLMVESGFVPRDYAYCGLVAAYSLSGDLQSALDVRARMIKAGQMPTVHVYNSLFAACERAQQFDWVIKLHAWMRQEGVQPNQSTLQLLHAVGKEGAISVEQQQLTMAALSAALAAAGSAMMRAGLF